MAPTVSASSPKSEAAKKESSPKGGQCLCSPTTHQGSFRCRFHRAQSSMRMLRSKSMPSGAKSTVPIPGKPLETA